MIDEFVAICCSSRILNNLFYQILFKYIFGVNDTHLYPHEQYFLDSLLWADWSIVQYLQCYPFGQVPSVNLAHEVRVLYNIWPASGVHSWIHWWKGCKILWDFHIWGLLKGEKRWNCRIVSGFHYEEWWPKPGGGGGATGKLILFYQQWFELEDFYRKINQD